MDSTELSSGAESENSDAVVENENSDDEELRAPSGRRARLDIMPHVDNGDDLSEHNNPAFDLMPHSMDNGDELSANYDVFESDQPNADESVFIDRTSESSTQNRSGMCKFWFILRVSLSKVLTNLKFGPRFPKYGPKRPYKLSTNVPNGAILLRFCDYL